MRIKICRKEAKESRYWLNLLDLEDTNEIRIAPSKIGSGIPGTNEYLWCNPPENKMSSLPPF